MLYTQDLEELIFHRHQLHETDELIVLSGYLGPRPVARLEELPFNSTVIYGMYGSEGIRPSLHNSLTNIQGEVDNLNIFYSNLPVHSKCYVWRRRGDIIHALIGSANFSVNGLTTPFREILAETTFDTFRPLNDYIAHILNNSISCLEVGMERVVEEREQFDHCLMTLLGRNGEVQNAAGLNWGQNPNNHTTPNDAYIALRTSHIRDFPNLFPPKQINPLEVDGRGRMQRHNDSIEIIWDDGLTMEGLLEGSQPVEGVIYPKQISSFPVKAELGEYIRNRIGVPLGQPVRRHHLESYGRTDIEVSLLGDGVYKFDFSV
ncbi:restriction endonuclease PLD domain-containing protein [Meridianimaribacter flavus]|uniref:NgoFVII restriction endonuclease n=1 Tax=Meridianimaribacter flavus TaxID=571115 RepID=A0ABY2G8I3_9FLAO|nr:restriction endonuclease PLD domain-containing protein [Meridianimaribacter flavus]TDY13436.1 NgoFVII restriction endonuclease [Meridianimaribacter flavus]